MNKQIVIGYSCFKCRANKFCKNLRKMKIYEGCKTTRNINAHLELIDYLASEAWQKRLVTDGWGSVQ